MNKEKSFISAVVYVHNNENSIYNFISDLICLLDANFENSEIICVNDFSTDNSVSEIKRASSDAGNVAMTVLNMSNFHGLEVAMNAGDELAIGDYLLEIDSAIPDYPIDTIMDVYRKVLEGYDIVSASPEIKQKLSSRVFYWLFHKFTNEQGHTKMQTESFRILSRRAVNRIDAMNRIVLYRKTLYENCGLRTMRVTYKTNPCKKPEGDDTQNRRYRRSLAVDSLIMFTDMGYIIARFMTTIMLLFSIVMMLYTIVIYVSSNPVAGWTTTIMFLSVAFCGLFAILMVIVKYLQLILRLNFRRKKYSFESIEKLTK
ncbi:MAG: glycosyltransferase [Lachnospiraceae bacterium]|nr:glycosyltransferase [Lachnospiraceae bacterium]